MAGSTGSARQEAERMVATILAMAQNGKGDDLSGTRKKVTDGLGALGDTLGDAVTGLIGQFTGPGSAPGDSSTGTAKAGATATADPESGSAAGHFFVGWSTGSAACCVCPICKAIAAVRDPSPATAVRLATGAGDVATGVATVLRGLSALSGSRPAPARPAKPAKPVFDPDVSWSAATRTTEPPAGPAVDPDPATSDPWTAATRTAPPVRPEPEREDA
jgi:hypothetical protein